MLSLSKNYTKRICTYKVSRTFTVFLPVRSVGVMGDGRKYDWVVSLRAVETIDFMTAHWASAIRPVRPRLQPHHQ